MKIIQTVNDLDERSGGVATCTYALLEKLIEDNCNVKLLTHQSKFKHVHREEDWIISLLDDSVTPVNISNNFRKFLNTHTYDIYHTNGMWLYINHLTCACAREKGKPYIITPHGMLYPEALARSTWKKWPLRKIWFDQDVREASCIHVTCEKEMENIRNLDYKGPIAIIGNPVTVPQYTAKIFSSREKTPSPFWGVAFLGRLHPRKKVENLLSGVYFSAQKHVKVYIMGKGDDNYEEFLKKETMRLGIADRVEFLGFINGKEKYERLGQIDALFVPSDMENFGMIIPEALIVGTPVMASLGTPWKSLNDECCGWWRDNSPESIAAVIDELYDMSVEKRKLMGHRGRDYVLRTFSANKVASQMHLLYKWLNGETDKPDFVYE